MIKEFISNDQYSDIKSFKYISINHSIFYDKYMSPFTDYIVEKYFSKNVA